MTFLQIPTDSQGAARRVHVGRGGPALRSRHGRAAFTLAELIVAVAVMSVLITGLASAIVIAGHALPGREGTAAALNSAGSATDELIEELRAAIWVTERTVTSITFTVPDRDGDGTPERIRYAWSGTAGDPLTSEYNGGGSNIVLDDVHEFALWYEVLTQTKEYPGLVVVGPNVLLSAGLAPYHSHEFKIKMNGWIGQYFAPSLPAEALSWSVTSVSFHAKQGTTDSPVTSVQLRRADIQKKPTDLILQAIDFDGNALTTSHAWHTVNFDQVTGVRPYEALCLVFQHVSGTEAMILHKDDHTPAGLVDTNNAGSSWNYDASRMIFHEIYGRVTTPGTPQTEVSEYLMSVQVALRSGSDDDARVITSVQTLNTPQLLSGLWLTDFDLDPTSDLNGDGVGDWEDRGGSFDPSALSAGVWGTDSTLVTAPDNDFTAQTVINARFRNTTVGGLGAILRINADWEGGTFAPLIVHLALQADSTQTLNVYGKTDSLTRVSLVRESGLSIDFVDLRLLIDPALDTVNIVVNGQDLGTYRYWKYAPVGDARVVGITSSGSNAEFDYVHIRTGEY